MANPNGWPNASSPRPRIEPASVDAGDARLHTPPGSNGFYVEKVDNYSPGTDSLSTDQANAQLVVDVPWELGDLAAYHFLGYQYVVGTQLKRQPPLMHPTFSHLRCRQIVNAQGYKWRGEDTVQPESLGPSTPRPNYARYDNYRLTLNFAPVPFSIRSDDQISADNGEWTRWVWIRSEGNVESIFVDGGTGSSGGNWKFKSEGVDASGAKVGALPFAGGRAMPYAMPKILATWFDVPIEFISKTGTPYIYDNIYAGLMRVNDATFLGFPAQTLLMDNPIIDLRPNPVPSTISETPSFLANITFVWHYLNPSTDQLGYKAGGGRITSVGHNMAISKSNNLWYPFHHETTGELFYKTYDYRKLFQKPV